MHVAVTLNKLKAAAPTMAPGPNSPDLKLFPTVSMIERRISEAEEPNAMSVKFATVAFQIGTSIS